MSQQLISLNPELQKLQSEGFDLELRDGVLYLHHVPFLNSKQEICDGSLAFTFSARGDILNPPTDHTAFWIGSRPYTITGCEIPSLINDTRNGWNGHNEAFYLSLYPDGLPGKRYADTYTKVKLYYNTIVGHAYQKNSVEAEKIHQTATETCNDDIFNYQDTNSARAGIVGVSNKMKGKKVAIVGVGGSGSYLLDLLAKTPVAEIHLFDDDVFSTHNAFRAPGAPTLNDFKESKTKVEYFATIYSAMHRHIVPHAERIIEDNISCLFDKDIVFLCVDSVKVRNFIIRHLANHGTPFIDSGMGIMMIKNQLTGQIRSTCYDGIHDDHLLSVFGSEDINDDGIYNTNIQVAELNSLAAILMMMQWKRLLGFYVSDTVSIRHDCFNIGMNKLLSV